MLSGRSDCLVPCDTLPEGQQLESSSKRQTLQAASCWQFAVYRTADKLSALANLVTKVAACKGFF